MKQTRVFNSILKASKQFCLDSYLTICRIVILVMLSASILTACTPSGMSGGGNTKDPGDGTGGSTGDGGGGQGVRCGVAKNPNLKNRLFVRDIYESAVNVKRKMKVIPNDVAGTATVSYEAIKVLTDSLKAHYGPASSKMEFTNEKFWNDFAQKMSFLDEDKELLPSQDANSAIVLITGCRIVQIAYWDESPGLSEEGTLYVNKKLWTELDQLNKIALLAHEYFFKQARKALYKNSDTVRVKVGELLSVEGLQPLFKNWAPALDKLSSSVLPRSRTGYKMCTGKSSEDPSAKLLLYQYEGSDKKQHIVIPQLSSSSINASYLKNADFTFDPDETPEFASAMDLLIYQSALLEGQYLAGLLTDDETTEHHNHWYPRWFENRNFVDSNFNEGDKGSVDMLLLMFGRMKETIWSDFLMSSLRPIKVSLVNPSADRLIRNDLKMKSREDLVLTVQRLIGKRLNKCSVLWPESDGWIASLKNEITESINTGKSPTLFPKWIEQLSKVDDTKCESDNENLYSHQLPALLYSLTINAYGRENVLGLLDKLALEIPEESFVNPGQIRVTQDSSTVNFILNCDDYETAYFKLSETKDSSHAELHPNKNVTVPKLNERRHREENIDVFIGQSINRLAEYLRFKGVSPEADPLHRLQSDGSEYNCYSQFDYMNLSCGHLKKFKAELASETDISIHQCSSEHSIWNENTKRTTTREVCAIVKMNSSKHSYKIYFAFPLNDDAAGPQIGFIRFLGLEKEKEEPFRLQYIPEK